MIHSGSLFGTGNTYTISYQQLTEKITLKLSSTDRENQSQFPYLVKQPIGKEQVFYFPWKDKKSTIVLYEINAKEVYCRWEGIHNGFLLVFETKRNIGENWKEFAEKYHSEIQKSLDVY
jgi:hypothetical protein